MIGTGLLVLLLALLPALLKKSTWFTAMIWIASALTLSGYLQVLMSAQPQVFELSVPVIGMSTDLVCTPLAAWFGLLFSIGFPLGSLYALGYLKAHPSSGPASHLLWLGLMFISMHLVLLASHSLMFMLAWELMSLASFLAILYDRSSAETVSGALYYLITMQIGAAVLMMGFASLYLESGSFSLSGARIGNLSKWLLLIGFAFKAGFFPFYSWLPRTHPVAPSHLSGLMSGLMIKTGIFGIIWVMYSSVWQPFEIYLLLGIALITAFNGVIHALAETHLKRALAYSSIENIGIIGIGLCFWQLGLLLDNPAMATLGLIGALLHSLFHSLFKPLLFYISGNVLIAAHSLNSDELGGLDKRMPRSSRLFLMGTASISALPLFCGFVSEFVIFGAIILGFGKHSLAQSISAALAGAGMAFVSALALIAFTKLYGIVFSGQARSEHAAHAKEPGALLLASPLILAVLCLVTGLLGWLPLLALRELVFSMGLSLYAYVWLLLTLQSVSVVLGMLLVFFGVIYLFKRRFGKLSIYPTWGCGYQKSSPRLQYTSGAYIDPLAYFLKPFTRRGIHLKGPSGYFPDQIEHQEELEDYLDSGPISWANKLLKSFLGLFDGIHNGRTNSYITWLLMALLLLLLWVLGVK